MSDKKAQENQQASQGSSTANPGNASGVKKPVVLVSQGTLTQMIKDAAYLYDADKRSRS